MKTGVVSWLFPPFGGDVSVGAGRTILALTTVTIIGVGDVEEAKFVSPP